VASHLNTRASAPAHRPDEPRQAAIERARARVRAAREFYKHLAVYILVSALLVVIDLATGGPSFVLGLGWAFYPILGWGLGVLLHAIKTFWSRPSLARDWEKRKFQQYLNEECEEDLQAGPDGGTR
jgi:hypothetical protein